MSKVQENLQTLFAKMEELISTKVVVGDPVHIGNVILVPLVDVTVGMGTGLSGAKEEEKTAKDTGGGAFGAKMSPTAMIAVVDGTVQLVNVKNQENVNKLIDMVPGALAKITEWMGKKGKDKDAAPAAAGEIVDVDVDMP